MQEYGLEKVHVLVVGRGTKDLMHPQKSEYYMIWFHFCVPHPCLCSRASFILPKTLSKKVIYYG